MRLALVCFYCLCFFVYVLYFIATMSFAGYFLSVLFCMLSMLISDSRFDLVWFRLSCDHGWIRSGSVHVRKQQQQQQQVSLIPPWEDQREWHRMTRMTRPDCAVMCNLINIHTYIHKIRLHSRRGKGMAESFSREKLRHAPQKEGG